MGFGVIDDDACQCISSDIDYNSVPAANISYSKQYYEKIESTQAANSGSIQFLLQGNEKDFMSLQESFLYVRAKILKSDKTSPPKPATAEGEIPDVSKVYPINYFIGSMFKNVKVFINGIRMSETNDLYAYKSYLEFLMSYDKSAVDNLGPVSMFYKDKNNYDLEYDNNGTKKEITEITNNNNSGAYNRFVRTQYGKDFEMFGRIHNDFFNQSKLIPGDVKLAIEFDRSDEKFCIMAKDDDTDYTVSIQEVILFVKKYRLTDTAHQELTLARLEENIPLKFPMRRVEMKYVTFGPNNAILQGNHIINNSELPKRVIIGLVHQDAFSGHYKYNPFHFQNFGVKELDLKMNDGGTPFYQYEIDYDNDKFFMAYLALLKGSGQLFKNESINITPAEFKKGCCLYAFDLTKNGIDSNTFELRENGSLSFVIKLDKEKDHSIAAVIYLEFDSIMMILPNNIATLK